MSNFRLPIGQATNTDLAIQTALEVLEKAAAETDTASPEGARVREAITTLEMILEQRGCEHFDAGVNDGKLTHLIDIIMFG